MTVPEEFLVEPTGVLASPSSFSGEAVADDSNTVWQVSPTVLRAASPIMPDSPSQPDSMTAVVPEPEASLFGPQSLATRPGDLWSAAMLERHIATLAAARRPLPPRASPEAAPDLVSEPRGRPADGDQPLRRSEESVPESHEELDWSDLDLLADILNDLAPETVG